MSIIDKVIENIDKGRAGGNKGLYMGYPKLQEFVPGVQQGTVYDIGGNTGAGKTAFTLSSFLYNPYEDFLIRKSIGEDIHLKVFLWSMEMSKDILITKGVCRKIFKDQHILVDINYVLSRGKNRISQEIYDLVLKTRSYFEEFEDVVTILPSMNPTGIHKAIKGYMLANGKQEFTPIKILEDGVEKTIERFDRYIPNHPNSYVIAIQDHIALMQTESGLTNVKAVIDKFVNYIIDDKLRYNITNVIVQQLNRNNESIDRMKSNSIEAQLSDFRDTSDTTHAADFVLALSNPFAYEISPYRGYDIKRLADRFRSVKVLKNRDGNANVVLGLSYLGEVGMFRELPTSEKMTSKEYQDIENLKKYGS